MTHISDTKEPNSLIARHLSWQESVAVATMSLNFPQTEEETLRYWREIEAFQTQLRLTESCPKFTFYDGPPFGMLPTPIVLK